MAKCVCPEEHTQNWQVLARRAASLTSPHRTTQKFALTGC